MLTDSLIVCNFYRDVTGEEVETGRQERREATVKEMGRGDEATAPAAFPISAVRARGCHFREGQGRSSKAFGPEIWVLLVAC